MRMPHSSLTSIALLLAIAVPACGTDTNAVDPGTTPPLGSSGGSDDAGTKAGPVKGTPDNDSITEENGIFVAPSGNDSSDGSRGRPLKTLSAAITTAARAGKIVFACTGTYAEALIVSDSISIIGGLDCADPLKWKTGAAPSRIESPTSPAATAKSIASPTRLEALDIVAPDATEPSASSIGFLADHSPGLTIVGSKITAGNGANGANGTAGIVLTQTGAVDGKQSVGPILCHPPGGGMLGLAGTCGYSPLSGAYSAQSGASGGTSKCTGAAGKDGSAGGAGGTGGVWQAKAGVGAFPNRWDPYQNNNDAFGGVGTGGAGTGANGTDGGNGAPALDMGTLTADGYTPASGNPGSDGSPGFGGHGATGGSTADMGTPNAGQFNSNEIDSGLGGAGGGAGGCPGLAGSQGTGGGASLGVALIESPIVIDGVAIQSGKGGSGGLGTYGSDATAGGRAGASFAKNPASTAGDGGRGGLAGISTNGSNGPSIGILTMGAAPTRQGTTKVTPGAAAPAIAAQSKTDTLGNPRTIPATPAGVAVESKSL